MGSNVNELKQRIQARRQHIEAELADLRAHGERAAQESRERLRAALDDLECHLKHGWDHMSEAVAGRLNDWLESTERGDAKGERPEQRAHRRAR